MFFSFFAEEWDGEEGGGGGAAGINCVCAAPTGPVLDRSSRFGLK